MPSRPDDHDESFRPSPAPPSAQGSSLLVDDTTDVTDSDRAPPIRDADRGRSGSADGGTAPPLVGYPLDGKGAPMKLD